MSIMRKSLLEAFTSNPVSDRMDFDQTRFLICAPVILPPTYGKKTLPSFVIDFHF